MLSSELTEKILQKAIARAGETYGFTLTTEDVRLAIMTFQLVKE
jgi:hypothetical protein